MRKALRRRAAAFRDFIGSEAAGGTVLMGAAAIALLIANSHAAPVYFGLLETYAGGLTILHWINDALMALFFLLVGLEIKRELIEGHLSTWPSRVLPCAAAAGGMIVPALVYAAINWGSPETMRGWAIPAATDIAFALGVLALLGSRVPASLKVFLVALAIIDDLGAIAIIAAFYSSELSPLWLGLSGAALVALTMFNRMGILRLTPYLIVGAALWFFVFKSGVHATLAGVALALTIPIARTEDSSPLHRVEHALQPWVAFFVVPLFGLANAGVALGNAGIETLLAPVPLGIALGLFAGKQVGVFLTAWIVVKAKWAPRPSQASFAQIYGVALICGIGFTMSLFIGLLAFPATPELQDEVKIGVLAGSILSAIAGAVVLILSAPRQSSKT
jgi:NhaA family Na+:H+ antiporter